MKFFGTAEPGSKVTIYLGVRGTPLNIGLGQYLYINPILLVPLASLRSSQPGTYNLPTTFPGLWSLIGLQTAFQSLVVNQQRGIALSNGVHMVVGG